jgi:hypothetical protein
MDFFYFESFLFIKYFNTKYIYNFQEKTNYRIVWFELIFWLYRCFNKSATFIFKNTLNTLFSLDELLLLLQSVATP